MGPVAQTPPQLYRQLLGLGIQTPQMLVIGDACEAAMQQSIQLLRGSGKPFSCHLIGMTSLFAEAVQEPQAIVAALLHGFLQERPGLDPDLLRRQCFVARHFGQPVAALLERYQAQGETRAGAAPAADDRSGFLVYAMRLADDLEDALDGAPWLHGQLDDQGGEQGSAQARVARFRSLAPVYAHCPALGLPTFWQRYQQGIEILDTEQRLSCLRRGRYSSYAVSALDLSQ